MSLPFHSFLLRGLWSSISRYRRAGSTIARTSTYYDSQSGRHINITDEVSTYFLQPADSTKHDKGAQQQQWILKEQERLGMRILKVIMGDKSSELETLGALQSRANNTFTRCYIMNSFESLDNLYCLQSLAGSLCDAGCDRLILTDSTENMNILDGYDMMETIENVLWNDVVGEPMAMRLGVKVSSDDKEKINELLGIALDLKVKNFDVAFNSGSRNDGGINNCGRAPVYTTLQKLLEERGIEHDLNRKFLSITNSEH